MVTVDVWSVIKDFASGFWIIWARAAGVNTERGEHPPGCSNESRDNKLWEVFSATVALRARLSSPHHYQIKPS